MNISKTYTIESKRFILRIPSKEDVSRVFTATRYVGFNDGMLWEPPESEEELIEPLKNNIIAWESGRGYSFSIERKNTSGMVGRISIRKMEENDVWDIGFWTHPDNQDQGVMTEALGVVLKFGFEKLSAVKIEAAHAIWNKASEKVLKNNGFTFVRYEEHGFQKQGKWVDENILEVTLSDYESMMSL